MRCRPTSLWRWRNFLTKCLQIRNGYFEIKWDGERAVAFIQDGEVEFRSRSGRNITPEYPELKSVVKQLSARRAIVDGEIVALDDEGRSDFTKIQPRFGVSESSDIFTARKIRSLIIFSICCTATGFDLRNCELEKRKGLLQKLLRPSDKIRYSDHVVEKGTELFEIARERRLEGIIAKRRDSPYIRKAHLFVVEVQNCTRSGRGDWRLDRAAERAATISARS